LTRKEWCDNCKRRKEAVYIPSEIQIDQFFENQRKINHRDPDAHKLYQLFDQGQKTWRNWAASRPFNGARCECGTATISLNRVISGIEWPEEFIHPNCGGVLSWKDEEDQIRLNWKQNIDLQITFFDADGKLHKEGEAARDLLMQLISQLAKDFTLQLPEENDLSIQTMRPLSIYRSPFHLLGVSCRDDRKVIIDRAEEKSLSHDPNACQQARTELTNPRLRLAAEMAWLPGVSPSRANAIITLVSKDPTCIWQQDGLPTLAQCNLMAVSFEALDSTALAVDVAIFAEQFSRLVSELDAEIVLKSVNEDRAISGFPDLKGTEQIDEEISKRKRIYWNAIKDAMNRLPSGELIGAMTLLVVSTTSNGTVHAPELVDELVDSYVLETQEFLHREAENAEKLVTAARESAKVGVSALKNTIDRLESVIRNWDKVAKPLQLSFKARGLDHDISKTLAYKVRSLAVDLFNEHDQLQQSSRLTQLLKELFSVVPDILDRVDEDVKALGDISRQREEATAIDPIRKLCDDISKSADRNPSLAQHEGQRLLEEGKALLKALPIKATSPTYLEARDMLAATLMHCAVAYGNQTSKWEPCIQFLQAALGMANDSKLKRKLQENLTIVEGNYKSLGDLESIKSAPSLYTINGFGVTLYGNTDKSPSDGSYMATYYLVFFFVPVLPLARYRVIPTGSGYRFLGKGPLRVFDKWHIAISLGLIALMFLKG